MSFLFVFLLSFNYTAAERTQNKSPVQYLLTVEQMVENDYPVPAYLADVFQKSEGWIETPQVSVDAEDPLTVYAIDCEMVCSLPLCNALK